MKQDNENKTGHDKKKNKKTKKQQHQQIANRKNTQRPDSTYDLTNRKK